MTKKILAIIFAITILFNICACEGSTQDVIKNDFDNSSISENDFDNCTPENYFGNWIFTDGTSYKLVCTINADGIFFERNLDGQRSNYGPYNYTASEDTNYTYLEYVGGVIVLLNEDMIVCCETDYIDNTIYSYIGVTPNGTKFDAVISGWFFREGAGTTEIPSEYEWVVQAIREGRDYDSPIYFYENAKVFSIPDYWAFPAVAITPDNQLTGMESITLKGLNGNGSCYIEAQGNFIIIDNS